MIIAMATVGFGFGGSFSVLVVALQDAFPPRFMDTVNSLNDFNRLMGGAIGTSILSSVLAASLAGSLSTTLTGKLSEQALLSLKSAGVKLDAQLLTSSEGLASLKRSLGYEKLYGEVLTALRESLASSLNLVFIGGLVTALIALSFLKEMPLRWQGGGMHGHGHDGHSPHHLQQHGHSEAETLEPVAGHGVR